MASVDGTIGGSWSMDEHEGVLRLAVSGTTSPGISLLMLRPEGGRLAVVGRLDGLGHAQELKSVRWFDDLAVLVTFRQVDPFYVVDLGDPTDPRVLGALHLPGWSSYLQPVGPHLVLGLGQTTTMPWAVVPEQRPRVTPSPRPVPIPPTPSPEGPGLPTDPTTASRGALDGVNLRFPQLRAKATLFDVTDPAHPRDVDTVTYPVGSLPMAATNPHQVTWLPDRQVLLTVLSGNAGWGWEPQASEPAAPVRLSILTIRGDNLDDRLLSLPDATDVHDVRTLPLADGRVVLVAGNAVRFVTV
jgi:hypothetical protein